MHSLQCTVIRRCLHTSLGKNQEKKLAGRVAIALGCTQGIGLAMARRIAQDGAHVVVSSRKQGYVDEAVELLTKEGLKASGHACDVASAEDRHSLLESTSKDHGGFDILINNAGVNAHTGNILTTPDSAFDKIIDVNLKSNFCLVRDAVPYMSHRQHQGSILLTSSAGAYRGSDYASAYVRSKAGILALTRAFVPDLLENNIRINCVALGLFDTSFAGKIIGNKSAYNHVCSIVPMKRAAKPIESAGIASFLCSDESSYVTGETFVIAGGVFTRL